MVNVVCLFYDIQSSKYYSFSLLFTLYKVHELHKQGGVISCHVNKHVSLISASTHTFEPYPNQELIAIQTATQFIARIKTPLHAFDCNPKTESNFFFFFSWPSPMMSPIRSLLFWMGPNSKT